MKTLRIVVVGILVSLAGFQFAEPAQAASLDNGSFMSLWKTYSHCQSTSDVTKLKENALTLTHAANGPLTEEGFVLPLPPKLEELVSTPAARFAVDVKAMAAACSLRAGIAAVVAGKLTDAKDLLRPILSYQPQSDYSYYSQQAKTLLSELEPSAIEVTLNIR